jgi:hypothetical protein
LYRRVRVVAVPALVVATVLFIWVVFVADGSADESPLRATARLLIVLALQVATMIGVVALKVLVDRRRRAIPQYPVGGGGYIFVRNLHPDAANRWVAANNGLIQRIA